MPALSPDGKRLAFVYRGDLWMADAVGGRAHSLTDHVESDANPVFSPDGSWIAFSSRRHGSWDIFVVPSEGGSPQRLTWHSGGDVPTGWSPDGKSLLFAGKRDHGQPAIYSLDVATLETRLVNEDYANLYWPSMSPDGSRVLYSRHGFPWTRPRYSGSAAAQVWVMDLKDGQRRPLTQNGFQHLWPQFLPGGQEWICVTVGERTPSASRLDELPVKWVDSTSRTPNLWTFSPDGKGRQRTAFVGGSVRFPSVATRSGDIAFEYEQDLWLLPSGGHDPRRIQLFVSGDEKQNSRRREKLTSGALESEPSPDGKRLAFRLRGDLWNITVDKPKGVAGRGAEFATRLTDWEGEDGDFVWSSDGKRLYFTSDRELNLRLYELELETRTVRPLWQRDEDVSGLQMSPDGRTLGFWVSGREGGLYLMNLETFQARRLVKIPGTHWYGLGGGRFSWSPDLRWIAYESRGDRLSQNIWVVSSDGGTPVNITRLYAQHGNPAWSPDGKYLAFSSNREGNGLYVVPLRWEEWRPVDADLKYEKPSGPVKVEIEFHDIERRIRKLFPQHPESDLTFAPDGTFYFLADGDVWSAGWDAKEARKATSGGGKSQLRIPPEGKKGFYLQGGDLFGFSLDSKSPEKVTFTADWERDVRAERKAAFLQFWRSYHRGFYDGNFHGRDWESIRARHEPLLGAVETPDEFATLLNMMVGELDASHAEVQPSSTPTLAVTPHLGFTVDETHRGPGLRIGRVPEGSPGWFAKTRLSPGEYVVAIDGRPVGWNEHLFEWINDKQDREFEFKVSATPAGENARLVKYRVLTQAEWNDLEYRNRIERRREWVRSHSNGRLAYIHIPGMLADNQAKFEHELYEQMVGRDGIVIDVRFNTGGNISDTLVDWLERRPHGFLRPRDGRVEVSPALAWDKKVVVLMNEHSFSNGEIFPYSMRARKLATLVGRPTPGYVIWTWDLRLVDGTGARMPMAGFYRLDGTTQENNGEVPDVDVPLSPDDWMKDRDPQLEKAVEILSAGGK